MLGAANFKKGELENYEGIFFKGCSWLTFNEFRRQKKECPTFQFPPFADKCLKAGFGTLRPRRLFKRK